MSKNRWHCKWRRGPRKHVIKVLVTGPDRAKMNRETQRWARDGKETVIAPIKKAPYWTW